MLKYFHLLTVKGCRLDDARFLILEAVNER